MRKINTYYLFLILLLAIPAACGFSQTTTNIKLSYNSSLIYGGARAGAEFLLKSDSIHKIRKSGRESHFINDLFIGVNLSWYHHPGFHENIYLTAGPIWRRTKPGGFFTEFSPEIGYSRTFLGGTTYLVNGSGIISIKKGAGYNYAFLSVGEGFGYDFSRSKSLPLMIYMKLNLMAMYPYNSTVYFRPALEAGFIYKLRDEK